MVKTTRTGSVAGRTALLICVLAMLALAGCSSIGGLRNENPNANNPYEKYYTGKEGIVASYENMPTRLYYYGPQDQGGNEFTFSVNVKNKGAAFSRGGIYVSGFDPRLLMFREIPIQGMGAGACGISIGSIGFGEMGGILHCDGVQISSGGGITSINVDSLRTLIQGIGQRFNKDWWTTSNFDFGVSYNNVNGGNFNINMNGMNTHIEYYQHGRLFIALLAGLDYRKNGGQEFLLAGNTYEFPGGETAYFTYNGKIVDWPPGLDQTTQHMLLTSCYQYTTFADPMVCIDPEPTSDNRKVCVPRSRTWSGGNGAPVAITSIEQENTPKKVIFHINVKNIGTGTVYDPGKLEKCSPYYPGRVTGEDLNIVYLGDVRIGTTGLRSTVNSNGMSCSPTVIRLDPNTKTGSTTCVYPMEFTQLKSAYETPLVVELWYGYSQALQKDVVIKRVT
jgi:hypothetical protein